MKEVSGGASLAERCFRSLWNTAKTAGLGKIGVAAATKWPFPVKVRLANGRDLFVDLRSSIGRGIFATGAFDMPAIAPALDVLSPGATFIDIGANIGFYSMLALQRVGPNGLVVCFEIDERPLTCLRKTVLIQGLSNVVIVEAAISDRDGTLSYVAQSESGHNRVNYSGDGSGIRCITLDSWVSARRLSRVDVIKIDVEGAELAALNGAKRVLQQYRPVVVCEASEDTAANFGYGVADLSDALRALSYDIAFVEGACSPTLIARPR